MPGELHVDRAVYQGTVWDLSLTGSLFIPKQAVKFKTGAHGRLHLGEGGHLSPHIHVARVADVQTSSIPAVRGIGIEFLHLTHAERQALEHLLAG